MNISYAYLETTSYCNLSCTYCNRENSSVHMSLFNFDRLLAQLQDQPILEAKLMGMGEPFMHPQFELICGKFKSTFPESNLITATNCQLKFDDRYKLALDAVDMCYLSIDGYRENFEHLRGGASWNKLLRFLENIGEYRQKFNRSVKLPINFTICPENVDDIERVMTLSSQFGLDEIRLNLVQNWTETEYNTELAKFTDDQIKYIATFKQYLKGKTPWDFNDCFWVHSGCMISANGDVRVCCMNTSTKPIGNVFSTPLDQLYLTDRFQTIQTGCNTNSPSEHCKTCSYKELSPYLAKIHGL